MVIRILPPDEAKNRARANIKAWKREKAMAERMKPPEPANPEKERKSEPEEAIPLPEKVKLSREQRVELNKQIADVYTRWIAAELSEGMLLSSLERLVRAGGDIDLRVQGTDETLLLNVISRGFAFQRIAMKMIELGADVNARDNKGMSALGMVRDWLGRIPNMMIGESYEERFPLVKLLESKGAKV